ncbi:MAG: fasciclin domain-containing protein [Blastocatellia bacterium]|nr:fasciclin domain-containing protein [Blastocatellia bacterium]
MKFIAFAVFSLFSLVLLGTPAAAQSCGKHQAQTKSAHVQKASYRTSATPDIVDTAVAGGFTTLVSAIKAAGLVDTLRGNGPFTVFAPTDEAFAKLPKGTLESLLKPENKDQLVKILTYHVVAGKVTAEQVVKLKDAKTVQGGKINIKVAGNKVKVNDATVTKTDIMTGNGVIHVIDTVLLPK